MESITKSIDVQVPVSTAYNQWTQFEDFPHFMENIEEVSQFNDTKLHWIAKLAGKKEEWDAEVTEQTPDQRIAWRSTSGADNAGVVTFHKLNEEETRVTLQMEYQTGSWLEKVGDKLGMPERRIESDLEQFKTFMEKRGKETGAWRGEVKAS